MVTKTGVKERFVTRIGIRGFCIDYLLFISPGTDRNVRCLFDQSSSERSEHWVVKEYVRSERTTGLMGGTGFARTERPEEQGGWRRIIR